MEVATSNPAEETNVWGGGTRPLNASYGKLMMWFFYRIRCLDLFWIFSFLWIFKI